MSSTNYANVIPTIATSLCSGGSGCAIGGSCTATSQCATGGCCGYIVNPSFGPSNQVFTQYETSLVVTDNNIYALTQAAYNALFGVAYQFTTQYCLPNTNAETTTSFYNSTGDFGIFTTSANTSNVNAYFCNNKIVYSPSLYTSIFPTVTTTASTAKSGLTTG